LLGFKASQPGPGPDAQRFCHSQQRVQADPLLAALDFSHIDRVQIRFFGKLFLAQSRLQPAGSQGL